ncbi:MULTISPECIES: DUF6234 family protein [Kitasatospora]|uniref:DUF6234 domain-containing protein n=1 Tax=Kitasatospora setae (strain ATCC 33774 / DSM 43861 / JCM 3304 / KCC A-0304 / NBRC 14216 / KM-6054) TaxID=452652 RepID=E4N0S3_KITSK|nr:MULTISPECIES: DUF6234 family protein [Kitasatospora]BAJ31757.1 hypothetical protein KSE_59870 [Kitasatospora setae KM-6054]
MTVTSSARPGPRSWSRPGRRMPLGADFGLFLVLFSAELVAFVLLVRAQPHDGPFAVVSEVTRSFLVWQGVLVLAAAVLAGLALYLRAPLAAGSQVLGVLVFAGLLLLSLRGYSHPYPAPHSVPLQGPASAGATACRSGSLCP